MELHGLVDLTNEQYHKGPGISKSMLDTIAPELEGTPLNYWDNYINEDREEREYKHCFSIGDGTHKIVLEPGTFEKTYAVGFDKKAYPNALDTIAEMKAELSKLNYAVSGSRQELAERLLYELEFPRERLMWFLEKDHLKSMENKIAIKADEYKDMSNSLKAIHRDYYAHNLLENCYVEQSFFVTTREIILDPITQEVIDVVDVLRKCRTDAITHNGKVIVDLKTTEDVSQIGFGKTIAKRRYHVQAAWYLDIMYLLFGDDAPTQFAFIAAQKKRPYDVGVYYLTKEQIQLGRMIYQRDLNQILICQHEGHWPGATNGQIMKAELPYWEMRKLTEGVI